MSYYKIRVKNRSTDKSTGNISSDISVFQYTNKVRTSLHAGAFLEFNNLLAEVIQRIIEPNPAPMYYYEFVDSNQGDLCARIDTGVANLVNYIVGGINE